MTDHRSVDDEPFRSTRPDNKQHGERYNPSDAHANLSDSELQAKRQATERDLYWSRHEQRGKSRGELEREWNDLKAEEARRRGKAWRYHHDRRDDFAFQKEAFISSGGQNATRTKVTGTAHDPKTTINWRNTDIGRERHEAIRTAYQERGLLVKGQHDLGHLAASEHGVDPEGVNRGVVNSKTPVHAVDRPNYTSQPSTSNRYRGWRTEERRVRKASADSPVHYEITSVATEKRGLHRETYRKMDGWQTIDGQRVQVVDPKVLHAGTDDLIVGRRKAEKHQNATPEDPVAAKRSKVREAAEARKKGPDLGKKASTSPKKSV